jgi:DNA polymerase III, delta subunit
MPVLPEKISDYFKHLKEKGVLSHAYLFLGDNFALIKDIAKLAGCSLPQGFCNTCWDCMRIEEENHPDLMIAEAEGVFIKIDQIRDAQKFLSLKSYCLKRKVLIIKGAHNLKIEAANAFLKTLEEPPANSFIILCAPSLEGILPTIASRAKRIFIPAEAPGDSFCGAEVIKSFLNGEKVKFSDRKKFHQFLTTFSYAVRDYIADKGGVNNRLLPAGEYEIILPACTIPKAAAILGKVLEIQAAYNSVNENLALNLIRMEL